MTDKEKIIAEIKRLRKEVKDNITELGNSESERIGLFKDLEIYDNILSFIDSMEDCPCIKCEGDGLPGTCASISVLGRCPLEYQKQEPVSEDLEKAAKHYLYSNILYDDVYVGNPTDKDCIEMFKAGAQWQLQQMIKKGADWLRSCLDNGLWVDQYLSEKDKEAVILTFKENMEEDFKL